MREWEQTGNIRVQSVSDSEQAEAAIEDAWSAWEAGAKASSDYVDVAEGYVRTRTFAERMSARAKGVASVLSERLGAAKMDGLPVIARADGSVGDVGESWWDEAFGADVRTVASASFGGQSVEDTMAGNSAVLFTAQTPAEAAAARAVWQSQQVGAFQGVSSQQAGAPQPAAEPQAPTASQGTPTPRPAAPASDAPTVRQQAQVRPRSVRDELDARLGNPEEAFPEKKRYTDEQQDLWAVALAALDERYEEQVNMAAPAPGARVDARERRDARRARGPCGRHRLHSVQAPGGPSRGRGHGQLCGPSRGPGARAQRERKRPQARAPQDPRLLQGD